MAASTKWEETWQNGLAEVNEANADKAALDEPTIWHASVAVGTWPILEEPLPDWPTDAWFACPGVRM